MSLRFEIFTADLDAVVAFYTQVLDFTLVRDERAAPIGYVALQRDTVQIGAAYRVDPIDRPARRPPTGIELVLEVDDLTAEHDRVVASGWPLEEPLKDRPWGLTDFRVLDPGGHYLRITQAASRQQSTPE
jgi:lactoylglutathione lyase